MDDDIPNDLKSSIDCKQGAVRAVRFNVDGNYCLTCGSDKSLKLWNPFTSTLLKSYGGHGYDVMDAKGSCDNSQIASCSLDKSVILWDVTTGNPLKKYRGHAGAVNCVSFNEESTVIVSGSLDGSVKIWDCKSHKKDPVQTLDEAKDSITSIQVSDHEILVSSADGSLRRYDIRSGLMFSDYVGHALTSVCFTRDGQCILVSVMDGTVKLFDKSNGELLGEYTGHTHKKYKIDSCLTVSDKTILSGSEDAKVYCWDLIESKLKLTLDHPNTKTIHSLSVHPKDNVLLTASEKEIHLWTAKDAIE